MTNWDLISIRKVGRQHLCNQNQHTEGQRSKRERGQKASNGPYSSLETKVWAKGAPLKLELDKTIQDCK
jgi:hypothetical protein